MAFFRMLLNPLKRKVSVFAAQIERLKSPKVFLYFLFKSITFCSTTKVFQSQLDETTENFQIK